MSDAMAKTTTGKGEEKDSKAVSVLAQTLWLAAQGKGSFADATARKAAWKLARRDQVKTARLVLRRLEKQGFALVAGAGAAAPADLDA